MNIALLIAAVVVIACVLMNKLSHKCGVPVLLAFILLGMFFGSDGVVKIPFENYNFAGDICSAALIFIMFYGGFGTNAREAKPVAVKAVLLSSLGVVITAALTGLFCHFVLRIALLESLLIGSVLGSTDAASVFSILRSKRLHLKYKTDSLLEIESGSNDPFAYMLTAIILSVMSGTAGGGTIALLIAGQIVFGVLGGILIALGALWFLRHFEFATAGFDAAFVIGAAVLAYALPSLIGGNGYLSTYIVGIILGNQPIRNKKSLVHFFDGITGLMQMLIFFLLGLLAFPSQIPHILLPSLVIALFLTFIARPAAVGAVLAPTRVRLSQYLVISWAGLRGAASIVFAIMATVSPAYMNNDVFHIAFCVVLLSILFQGSLLPVLARKLNMIDKSGNVMKTFSDYSADERVQFVRLAIEQDNAWAGKQIRDILTPPDMLIAVILRDGKTIIPNGDTKIEAGDNIVLSAPMLNDCGDTRFYEIMAKDKRAWIGKSIAELSLPDDSLVMMIERNHHTVIPDGNTKIEAEDTLVLIMEDTRKNKTE